MAVIVDRMIHGRGTPDAVWQASTQLSEATLTTAARLVPPRHRAVIIAPHPDDEILGAGGLIRQLQALRRDMLLVAVTDGCGSHPQSTIWTPDRLLQQRPKESATALKRLGANHIEVHRLGLIDGKVEEQQILLTRMLTDSLKENDIVFSTWRLDGHPDHEAVGQAAHIASHVYCVPHIEVPIWAWHWSCPGDIRIPWARLRKLPLSATDHLKKWQAVSAFVSQLEPDASTKSGPILPDYALARLRHPAEYFFI